MTVDELLSEVERLQAVDRKAGATTLSALQNAWYCHEQRDAAGARLDCFAEPAWLELAKSWTKEALTRACHRKARK